MSLFRKKRENIYKEESIKKDKIETKAQDSKTTSEILMELSINEQIRKFEEDKKKREKKLTESEDIDISITLEDVSCDSIRNTIENYTKNFNNYIDFLNTFLDDNFKFDLENSSFIINRNYFYHEIFKNMYEYHIIWKFGFKNNWNIVDNACCLSIEYFICEDMSENKEVNFKDLQIKIIRPEFLYEDENEKGIYIDNQSLFYSKIAEKLQFYYGKEQYNLEEILSEDNTLNIILEVKKIKEAYELKNKVNKAEFIIV